LGKSLALAPLYAHDVRVLDLTDYELLWPPDLFAAEARRILSQLKPDAGALDLLLREAFRDAVADDIAAAVAGNPFGRTAAILLLPDCVRELAERAHEIRRSSVPRPYWPQRHGREIRSGPLDRVRVREGFAELVRELENRGYFDQIFPQRCVDDYPGDEVDPSTELEKRLGVPGLWPLAPSGWNEETFYGLIEVYHDLVARPRTRTSHDFEGCGWHYSGFSATAGRGVYRWRVNELLSAAHINYRLADSGEDMGRLVEVFDDGRTALISEALEHAEPDLAGRIRHAVALFRNRTAEAEDKRSAVLALAGILEERRQLIKDRLLRKDEGALFQIANEFALRHRNEQQRPDYDPAFLDWIFWWYLGTVELTNRLIARQPDEPESGR
jgi:hypothetical protein